MSTDTSIRVEHKEGAHWKLVERYEFSYNSLADILAKLVENRARPAGNVSSQQELRDRLPDDLSQELLAEVQTLETLVPIRSIVIEVGWLLLSELVLFDWNAVYREHPLYQETYGDVIGETFLNAIVGKQLERYADPERVRFVYWTMT